MPFPRTADQHLSTWFTSSSRKPLILRGARQTGKTTAVRQLGERAPCYLELNFERHSDLALVRTCRSAEELLSRLQQRHDLVDLPANTLLFLDEVQEHTQALGWLRFFHEDHPEIAVVAAGSLLEVRLRDTLLPFPVGRVEFLRLEPLTFLEFLRVTGGTRLALDLEQAFLERGAVDEGLHDLAMERFRKFLLVGGLPEAVEVWRKGENLVEVRHVHDALRQAYAEDLLKYGTRTGTRYLETILASAPAFFGARFKVRNLGPGERDAPLTQALELLERAMVLHRAVPTASFALPFIVRARAARKLLPLDMGLALSQLGIQIEHLEGRACETLLEGRIAEAFVGVQLLAANPEQPRSLSFWTREGQAKSNAEVDYLISGQGGVLPIEVKSGAAGSLKSLHQFLAQARLGSGVRLSAAPGGVQDLDVKLPGGQSLKYRLHSLPLYLAELLPRLPRSLCVG